MPSPEFQRDVPLGYFTDGDDVILIASNYGQTRHPSWYYNLLKNPQCQLFPEGRTDRGGHFVARLTEGEDHDRLFAPRGGYASNFASYAVKTDGVRTINVFRLSPRSLATEPGRENLHGWSRPTTHR